MTKKNSSRSKIAFTTLGCRVNQYDTQVLKERLEEASFQSVPFHEHADVYVINTCTVTAAADAEGRLLVRRAKAQNPDSFVVVTGCLATDRPQEMASLPGVIWWFLTPRNPLFCVKLFKSNPYWVMWG